jgi:hypothetical protein
MLTVSRVLGLDVGGANLKAAHVDGTARSASFQVWRRPAELGDAVVELIGRMASFDWLAVTMTAELCDCFESKANGVNAVLDAVEFAVGRLPRLVTVGVWLNDGRLVTPAAARAEPLRAAAANWLALATWAGRYCFDGPALLIDVGSTTTDIVPLRDGVPVPRGRTDLERLSCGELIYSGVRRTPVFALVRTLDVAGRCCRVAAELFATTRDVYLWLGDLPEQPDDRDTADGRTATRDAAGCRLARVVCADRSMLTDADIDSIARQIAAAQLTDLLAARSQVEAKLGSAAGTVIIAGSGEFLARRLASQGQAGTAQLISLAELHGPAISSAACAYALAVLASERLTGEAGTEAAVQSEVPAPLTTQHSPPTIVLKLGGSLLDLPDLGDRLRRWLDASGTPQVILLIGGGPAAELVRQRDRIDGLGGEESHWLAIRAMTFNSCLVESLLENSRVVTSLAQCRAAWQDGVTPILDPHAFLLSDTARREPLPHTWQVTSDSIAARVARAVEADDLVLLKSVAWPDGDIAEAARRGIVDEHLPWELRQAPQLKARIENFRDHAPPCQTLSNQAANSPANGPS